MPGVGRTGDHRQKALAADAAQRCVDSDLVRLGRRTAGEVNQWRE